MNLFWLVVFYLFIMFLEVWLESRGSLRTPTSLTEAMKRNALMAILFAAFVAVPEAFRGTLAENGPVTLLLVLAAFVVGVGLDGIRLRRGWTETEQ